MIATSATPSKATPMTDPRDDTLTELTSPFAFDATLARVTETIEAAGLTIFARIDHAENARKAGLTMPPTTVLIYGNAKGGTPIMLAAPRAALDLPLHVLIRETPTGTLIAFHPIAATLHRAGVPDEIAEKLTPAQHLLTKAIAP